MYFSEFLETCTIGWASFCEGGVGVGKESAFFILVGGDGTHHPHPGLWPNSPPGGPSAPGQTAQHRQQRRPCQNQGGKDTMAYSYPDAGHAAPVCTRYQTGRAVAIGTAAGRWRAGNSSIARIVIALSQAWSSDSNMHNYHINLLVYLVIVICYQILDLPP